MRKIAQVTFLVLLNFLLVFLGFELYFRFLYDTTDILNYGLSSQRWYQRHVQVNSFGFRDEEVTDKLANNQEDTISVFFIGDSFTFGLGIKKVEDRYSNLVCSALKEKHQNLECYNLSFHGWDLRSYVDTFEEYAGVIGSPDVVMFQYFMNDIEIYDRLRAEPTELSTSDLDSFMGYVHSAPSRPVFNYLYRNSYAFNFFYLRYRLFSSVKGITYEEVLQNDYADDKKYQLVEDEFERISTLSQQYSAEAGFVIFPLMDADRKTYKLTKVHKQIQSSLSAQEIPWVDLTKTFWGYSPKQMIVNPFDAHPNERANRLAAQEVLELVSSLLEQQITTSSATKFQHINSCHYYQLSE